MSDILCTFNEKGELAPLPDHVIELYFDTASDMEVFQKFMESGKMAEAFKEWKKSLRGAE